jgi:histone deacetylase 11
LKQLRTNRSVLLDVYEIEVEKAPLTPEDNRLILDPIRYQVSCVILAAVIAYVRGSCLTLQGGHHHAAPNHGEGRGMLADVPISWLILRKNLIDTGIKPNPRALYVDVDVHHANGFARCRLDNAVFRESFDIADLFNESIWPVFGNKTECDSIGGLTVCKTFRSWVSTKQYLDLFRSLLSEVDALGRQYDIVYYMCSNDALIGDPLGETRVSAKGIKERDVIFMQWARSKQLPVVIIPGPGYVKLMFNEFLN